MDTFKEWLGISIQCVQLLIILFSAVWAYFRFRKEDPLHPRIEFDVKCKFFGPQQNAYLSSFDVTAYNKGNVEHNFEEIRLKIRGIKTDEALTEFKEHAPRVEFPVEIVKGINIVPSKYKYFFVRPGVNQTFNFTTHVGANIRFILVRATFKYRSSNEVHSIEKTFEVKEDNS